MTDTEQSTTSVSVDTCTQGLTTNRCGEPTDALVRVLASWGWTSGLPRCHEHAVDLRKRLEAKGMTVMTQEIR